jgi:hypothetical protein
MPSLPPHQVMLGAWDTINSALIFFSKLYNIMIRLLLIPIKIC